MAPGSRSRSPPAARPLSNYRWRSPISDPRCPLGSRPEINTQQEDGKPAGDADSSHIGDDIFSMADLQEALNTCYVGNSTPGRTRLPQQSTYARALIRRDRDQTRTIRNNDEAQPETGRLPFSNATFSFTSNRQMSFATPSHPATYQILASGNDPCGPIIPSIERDEEEAPIGESSPSHCHICAHRQSVSCRCSNPVRVPGVCAECRGYGPTREVCPLIGMAGERRAMK